METVRRKNYGGWVYKLNVGDYCTKDITRPVILANDYDGTINAVRMQETFYLVYEDSGKVNYLFSSQPQHIQRFYSKYIIQENGIEKTVENLKFHRWYRFNVRIPDELCSVECISQNPLVFRVRNGFGQEVDLLTALDFKLQFNIASMSKTFKEVLAKVSSVRIADKETLVKNANNSKATFRDEMRNYISTILNPNNNARMVRKNINVTEELERINNKVNCYYMLTTEAVYGFYYYNHKFYCVLAPYPIKDFIKDSIKDLIVYLDNLFFVQKKYFFVSNTFSEFCNRVKSILIYQDYGDKLKTSQIMSIDLYMTFSNYSHHDDETINKLLRAKNFKLSQQDEKTIRANLQNKTWLEQDNRKLSDKSFSLSYESYIFRCWFAAVSMYNYIKETAIKDTVLFRGNGTQCIDEKGNINYFRLNHFISTTVFPEITFRFVRFQPKELKPKIYVIKDMHKGFDMYNLSNYDEAEILLNCDDCIENVKQDVIKSKEFYYLDNYPVYDVLLSKNNNFSLIDNSYYFNHWKDIVLYNKSNTLLFKSEREKINIDLRRLRLDVAGTDKYIIFIYDLNKTNLTKREAYFRIETNIDGMNIGNIFKYPYFNEDFAERFTDWVRAIFDEMTKLNQIIPFSTETLSNVNSSISFLKLDKDYAKFYIARLLQIFGTNYICVSGFRKINNLPDSEVVQSNVTRNRLLYQIDLYDTDNVTCAIFLLFEFFRTQEKTVLSAYYFDNKYSALDMYKLHENIRESRRKGYFACEEPVSFTTTTNMLNICNLILQKFNVDVTERIIKAVQLVGSYKRKCITDIDIIEKDNICELIFEFDYDKSNSLMLQLEPTGLVLKTNERIRRFWTPICSNPSDIAAELVDYLDYLDYLDYDNKMGVSIK